METRPLNTFSVGAIVDIPTTCFMGIEINSINDSGVGITWSGGHTVLSGQSPAILAVAKEKPIDPVTGEVIEVKRGRKKASPNLLINIPGEEFTIKELAEFNKVKYHEVLDFIKDNCEPATDEMGIALLAERAEGQRGKSAALYKLKE